MTAEEINSSFDSEWVLVADPETDANLVVKRGRVIWHGKDKDELYRRMAELKPPKSAVLFTGNLLGNTVIII
jgi:hypothetical protein